MQKIIHVLITGVMGGSIFNHQVLAEEKAPSVEKEIVKKMLEGVEADDLAFDDEGKRKKIIAGDCTFSYNKISIKDNQTKTDAEVFSNINMSGELRYHHNIYQTFYASTFLSASRWSFQNIPDRTFTPASLTTMNYGAGALYYPSARGSVKLNIASRETVYFQATNSDTAEMIKGRHFSTILGGMLRIKTLDQWQLNSKLDLIYDFSGTANGIKTISAFSQELGLDFERKIVLKNIAPKIGILVTRTVANTSDFKQVHTDFGLNFGASYLFQ